MYFRSLCMCIVLRFIHVSLCQECQTSVSQLHNNPGVDSVTMTLTNHNNLFNFNDDDSYVCVPNNVGPFTMTITYSSPVLLTRIGIHGRDRTFPLSNQFVTSFSLSFSEDNDNFTEYIQDNRSEFTVTNVEQRSFVLQSPITASSIKVTINRWNGQPCMSLLMLGCNYSDVERVNVTNGTANNTDSSLLGDTTIVLTTTEIESVTTTATEIESVTTTTTVIQTTTESYTITVTADLNCTPSPSLTQSSGAAASTSCSSDTDNTPIYVAVAIVIVGLLITIIVVIVGVLLCRHYQKDKKSAQSLTDKYKTANSANSTGVSIVEVDNDLYGKDVQLRSQSASPEDDESAQISLYNSVPDVIETANNPQYGDTMKQSDTTANPNSKNENVYSYAIP